MRTVEAVELVAALAAVEGRASAARRLAVGFGADEVILLLHDREADALLPTLGLRKTLPGGPAWRQFLARVRVAGIHRGELPDGPGKPPVCAVACTGDGIAALFLGGNVSDDSARVMCATLPLLELAFRTQFDLRVATGELEAARCEIRQSVSLMKALDEARRQVDRTLTELDAQARSLDDARARAEDATRAKDQFMAMLGHELRNPLAPIVTALELLRRRGVWSQEHEIMQRQVGHMLRLVEDLLDVSRITSGKLALHPESLELATVLASAIETARPLLDQRRQELRVDMATAGLGVSADAARLAQVFANLLTNASKYSDPGTCVTVTARRMGDLVTVAVADQGMGIDPGMLEAVFVLFEQQGRGIDRAQGGLGLGLAIVRSLVALHGGRVRAHSAGIGRGSRFIVELPFAPAVESAAVPRAPSVAVAVPADSARILLVDDNADAVGTLAVAFELMGFSVGIASDGAAALQCARRFQPAVAVLDIGLPGMDGHELARRLREEHGTSIRLIALTGYGQSSDRERSRDAGFDAHLVKPVDFCELHQTLERLLAQGVDQAAPQ
ncbi:MAG TPA: ATP-binding protein [Lysobacter sp.]